MRAKKNAKTRFRRFEIEQLERKELFTSLVADSTDTGGQADVPNATGYSFYGRYFTPSDHSGSSAALLSGEVVLIGTIL